MNRLLDNDRDYAEERAEARDREISLGTATILGMFFALALVCAGFFGFGYTMGRKSAQAAAVVAVEAATGGFGAAKPAAGSTAQVVPAYVAPKTVLPARESSVPEQVVVPAPVVRQAPAAAVSAPVATQSAQTVVATPPVPVAVKPVTIASATPVALPPAPAIVASGTFMVQVAAVSSQEVADILLTSLKRKGYAVAVHMEPQDKLLHVQIGPFATRKDADGMKEHLLHDGFNAIVK